MPNILQITASAHGSAGTSTLGAAKLATDLGGPVTLRDLGQNTLPIISGDWADARLVDLAERTATQSELLALSDTLVAELQAADTIIIGTPIYNFAAPAALKAWMDLVARPRVTFRYTENGPEGLLKDKKAIIVVSSGGVPVGSPADHLTPHLKMFLGFLDITDVEVFAANDVMPQAA